MLISFLLLTLVFFSFVVYTFLIKKDYKRITFLYSFSLITIFYTPNLYFFFGGESYRFFSDVSLIEYFHISTLTIFIYLILSLFIDSLHVKRDNLEIKDNFFIKIYFLFFLVSIILYYIVYFKQFPLVQLIFNNKLIDRPDMTGAIPHFYTVSTIVSIIIPSIYFFYINDIKGKYKHILINLILFFLFLASGNKGFIIYYLIFMWLYVFKAKIDYKLFLIFVFSMFIYLLTKGITEINSDVLQYLINSSFRRFFVTQGTCFIHRIDMINDGYDFINNSNPRGLKFDVFMHMYNTNMIGSAPTFYTGDFIVKYGKFFSFLMFVIISIILLYTSKYLHRLETNRKLFIYWNIYAILFMIVMAEISFTSLVRISVGILNICMVILLSKIKLNNLNKQKEGYGFNNNTM